MNPIVEATRDLEPSPAGIGWGGKRLTEMLAESDRLFAETGSYQGLTGELDLMSSDPIGYEKLFNPALQFEDDRGKQPEGRAEQRGIYRGQPVPAFENHEQRKQR